MVWHFSIEFTISDYRKGQVLLAISVSKRERVSTWSKTALLRSPHHCAYTRPTVRSRARQSKVWFSDVERALRNVNQPGSDQPSEALGRGKWAPREETSSRGLWMAPPLAGRINCQIIYGRTRRGKRGRPIWLLFSAGCMQLRFGQRGDRPGWGELAWSSKLVPPLFANTFARQCTYTWAKMVCRPAWKVLHVAKLKDFLCGLRNAWNIIFLLLNNVFFEMH